MLDRMIAFAAKMHEGQKDRQGKPYILHPLEVMRLLNSDDEELNCIAVGHDLLEDTSATYPVLLNFFNVRVANGILAVSNTTHLLYDQFIDQRVLPNLDAVRVKMADMQHNSDIRRNPSEKQLAKYSRNYPKLVKRLEESHLNYPEELKEIKHLADGYFRKAEYYKEVLNPLFSQIQEVRTKLGL